MTKAWQRQIREKAAAADPALLSRFYGIGVDSAEVRRIDSSTAKAVILQYEWLGTMPAQLQLAAGLFLGGNLAAVECFSSTRPAGDYMVQGKKAVCLARGACVHWCPVWGASFLISRSLKMLDPTEFWFAVAFSDTEAGEIGTVYQASNWTCLGPVSRGNKFWVSPDGKRHDHERPRSVARSRDPEFKIKKLLNPRVVQQVKDEMVAAGWKHQTGGARYRYAVPLYRTQKERKERQRILDEVKHEFPKRQSARVHAVSNTEARFDPAMPLQI